MTAYTHTNVCFNEAIEIELEPPASVKKTTFTYQEVLAVVAECKALGFDVRSVVTKRTTSIYMCKAVEKWGVIQTVRQYVGMGEFIPIGVMWCGNGTISYHWPDELYLIHPAIPDAALETSLRRQEYT